MKQVLVGLFVCLSLFGHAQDYLEDDETKLIFTEFGDGIPSEIRNSFSNFDSNTDFGDRVEGLLVKPYIATNAQKSFIKLEKENIGRVVLYAKLFNKNDSILFNSLSQRTGTVTIIPYRKNERFDHMISKTDFSEDIFQQIHFNVNKAGIDQIEIIFDTPNDLFIVEKLKVIPFNENGIAYYTELERSEKAILDMADNLENNANILKTNHIDQLGKIETYHDNLSKLITGSLFQGVANEKANSLNPFKNGAFINHYMVVLDKANEAERAKIEKASTNLGQSNFGNIAVTLGNLYTGGSFSSLINLVSNVFSKSIKLNGDEPLLNINSEFYKQISANGDKLKLLKVNDDAKAEINDVIKKNDAFKSYITKITTFIKEDVETMGELNKDILLAKVFRDDLEELTWDIIEPYASGQRDEYIQSNNVEFVKIGVLMERGFNADTMKLASFRTARTHSITTIKKFNDLVAKYARTTSKIKTHYDFLYETRPKERVNALDDLASNLPQNMVLDWVKGQQRIMEEYRKDDGLKRFLAQATGKE